MNLVELIGLGEGNKKPLGKLKNDVKRSVRKTFSAKTRDILKDVEPRLTVCILLYCTSTQAYGCQHDISACLLDAYYELRRVRVPTAWKCIGLLLCTMSTCRRW